MFAILLILPKELRKKEQQNKETLILKWGFEAAAAH